MMKHLTALMFGGALLLTAGAAELIKPELALPKGWTAAEGKVTQTADNKNTVAKSKTPAAPAAMTFEAVVKVTDRTVNPKMWKTAGIAVERDSRNFIQLGLVETPAENNGNRRFVELKQMNNGKWGSGVGLAKAECRENFNWKIGEAYKLRLTVTSRSAVGEVLDLGGKVLTKIDMVFTTGEAVNTGVPALRGNFFSVVYEGMGYELK